MVEQLCRDNVTIHRAVNDLILLRYFQYRSWKTGGCTGLGFKLATVVHQLDEGKRLLVLLFRTPRNSKVKRAGH